VGGLSTAISSGKVLGVWSFVAATFRRLNRSSQYESSGKRKEDL
jgi:hypothetical protein